MLLTKMIKDLWNHRVVESGTSGIWTYKKYADGTFKCNAHISESIAASGGVFSTHYGYRHAFTYPITFVSLPSVTHDEMVGGTYTLNAGNAGETTTGFTALCVAIETSGTQTVKWNVQVEGKWK